jgi:Icc-related predicted phosphoesterase
MKILHVSDLHFTKHWYHWLSNEAPAHDLLVISGDLLDLHNVTAHSKQIQWVSQWIDSHPRPVCVCSGNHDLEWDARTERWTPAYWLRAFDNPLVRGDGQRVMLDGLSLLTISCTTRPKGAPADIWVVHAPPTNTAVARRPSGRDAGDPDLVASVRSHTPRVVLAGHVHDPIHWHERTESTLYLNPGHTAGAPFPNHIILQTQDMSCRFFADQNSDESMPFEIGKPATAIETGGVATSAA